LSASVTKTAWKSMTSHERDQFDRDGYLLIRGALSPDEVDFCRAAMDRVYAERAGGGALHLLSAVRNCPELVGLLDHPAVFGYVWSMLGWNAHVYHSHIDVHPRITERKPFWWHWHQDGGRQNREIETDPRPRLSVKLAYWLSDVSEPGRGNLTIVPGSHKTNWLPGPPSRGVEWPQPPGAIEVTVNPGDVLFFDRRIWHARSDNYSDITRKVAFFGYTYRWIAVRDEVADLPATEWWQDINPVQRQLLGNIGDGTGDHAWGHFPETTPLYGELAARGLLDSSIPALIP
jgi:ectoine hydroxylase-related dioxygenase (phytanoyl-CoA dioxygenase family)